MRKLVTNGLAAALASLGLVLSPLVHAQVEQVDPDAVYSDDYGSTDAYDGGAYDGGDSYDSGAYDGGSYQAPTYDGTQAGGYESGSYDQGGGYDTGATYDGTQQDEWSDPNAPTGDMQDQPSSATTEGYYAADPKTGATVPAEDTYQKDDLIGAAEGVFGKGAEGLAGLIEKILAEQGQPNAYIVGREGGGALVVGLRYGSGTLFHKVEGQRVVYWTGPSIGFDAGAQAGNTFVLVYNLYDTSDLFHRYAAGEGAAYLVGGFHVSYLRRGKVVLIPVRMGVGLRLGANVGYMKFSEKQNWFPF